jgi:protein-tyrosine kinase
MSVSERLFKDPAVLQDARKDPGVLQEPRKDTAVVQDVRKDPGVLQDARTDRRIGAILVEQMKLTSEHVAQVLDAQRATGSRFGDVAVQLGLISADDLRRAIAEQYDLPYLRPENRDVNSELVVSSQPFHPCAEQMRALRSQLLIRWANGGIRARMLAIVSPGRHEGRSYLAANLAVSFAQLGEPTLLIDADMRRPRQGRIFEVDEGIGLSAALSGRATLRSSVIPLPRFGRLSLLPAGARPPNPLELLSRDSFAILLHELQREYQVVLIDTPAAEPCADAQTVAFRAGGALVLARKDYTNLKATSRLIRALGDAGASVAGTVLNSF